MLLRRREGKCSGKKQEQKEGRDGQGAGEQGKGLSHAVPGPTRFDQVAEGSRELSSLPGCHGDTRAPWGTETRAHRTGKAR